MTTHSTHSWRVGLFYGTHVKLTGKALPAAITVQASSAADAIRAARAEVPESSGTTHVGRLR